jgi:hypothetical protein
MTTTHISEVNVADLHIVVAALAVHGEFVGYTAASAPLSYAEALSVWESKQRFKRGIHAHGRKPHYVREYAVRSVADPRFAPLVSHGYADGRTRDGRCGNGDYGYIKAARAWAKLHGYEGRSGGWIYRPDGKIVTQGWHSFALYLRRNNRIAQSTENGLWYVLDQELVA